MCGKTDKVYRITDLRQALIHYAVPSTAAVAVLAVCNVLSEIVAEIRPACTVTAIDGHFAAKPMSRATGSG